MRGDRENVIIEKTFKYALGIITFCEILELNKKYSLAKQLFRSGTSIGANVNEAQNAESRLDFIHKMKIAAKEGDETIYWLKLCQNSKNYPDPGDLLERCEEIMRILSKIIGTSKRNSN